MNKWRSKLRETNDALAEAHKSWRDERLGEREQRASEREQSLQEREERVSLQLAEMRRIEGRKLWRRLGTVLVATVTGIVGFLLGLAMGQNLGSVPQQGYVSSNSATSDRQSAATEQAPATTATAVDTSSTSDDSQSQTPPTPSMGGCRQRGIAYFKEIGSYPTLNSPPDAGRSAEDVAMERCTRSPYAFGSGY